ncbi:MAG: IS1 family transposase [Magnetococcales bacterium]|nr:IS1 family transposase [Magnetococcales bacterium]
MAVLEVRCPACNGLNVVRYGRQPNGKQRYLCQDLTCTRRIFLLRTPHESPLDRMPTEMRQVIERALAGVSIEETARDLRLPSGTVAEVFGVLARFNAPPTGVTRSTQALRRRRATG